MKKFLAATSVIAASALLLAGCASATPTATKTAASAAGVDSAAAALLPDSYKTAGINVGSDIPYAPMEMFDTKNNPIGFDVDLANAIGVKLGVSIKFEKQAFDTLIPSLQAGKHDLAISSMSDTVERQKVLDFVDYFNGGASLLVKAGNTSIKGIADLCGQAAAAEAATWEVDLLKSQSDECVKAGKKPITIQNLPDDPSALSAVKAGNAAAYLGDSQVVAYDVKNAGSGKDFALVIDPTNPNGYEAGLIGVGVLKKNTGLRDAVQAAVQAIMDDGTYDNLLTKWNLNSFKIESATVNGTK